MAADTAAHLAAVAAVPLPPSCASSCWMSGSPSAASAARAASLRCGAPGDAFGTPRSASAPESPVYAAAAAAGASRPAAAAPASACSGSAVFEQLSLEVPLVMSIAEPPPGVAVSAAPAAAGTCLQRSPPPSPPPEKPLLTSCSTTFGVSPPSPSPDLCSGAAARPAAAAPRQVAAPVLSPEADALAFAQLLVSVGLSSEEARRIVALGSNGRQVSAAALAASAAPPPRKAAQRPHARYYDTAPPPGSPARRPACLPPPAAHRLEQPPAPAPDRRVGPPISSQPAGSPAPAAVREPVLYQSPLRSAPHPARALCEMPAFSSGDVPPEIRQALLDACEESPPVTPTRGRSSRPGCLHGGAPAAPPLDDVVARALQVARAAIRSANAAAG
eukprot:TRINITY_DN13058_c0_g1_i1.p1 TRINITY_DN13058_c0_g1~~TRINITY_DN13058_c0_g1_i1.p1  ORF type:complete len:416 (+),score=77.35 TRINITY_DN13058_c0_g1_i1:86-1249(+)